MSKSNRFSDIRPALSEATMKAIGSFGFTHMTPVQATSIPLFLQHKDVCVEATTGSGKTLAFGIPIFEMLHKVSPALGKHDLGAMVLAPTRELAVQIHEVLSQLAAAHSGLHCVLFVGGTSVQDDIANYIEHGGQIMVGTPGRVIDICNRTTQINLKRLEVLVLDEADTLLDMGFKESINQILAMLPKQRRTGLFSATQTKEVKELARAGLRNPVSVSVRVQAKAEEVQKGKTAAASSSSSATPQATPSSLDNWYLIREYDQRPSEMIQFIKQHQDEKIIIFCATCACVEYYSQAFHQLTRGEHHILPKSLQVIGFHGKMIPKKRSLLYKKFKGLSSGVMFSTDVAARGIDIPDVDWIIQLAAPKDPAFFVHRVGRTARAGKKGGALLFITKEEEAYIDLLRGRGVPLHNGEDNAMFTQLVRGVAGSVETTPVLEELKSLSKQDRDVLEAGSTAFMSYLKAYKEHLCSFIFRLEHLDIGSLARSYGLLRLPKIAETRGVKGKPIDFETDPTDTSTIPYRHHEKEQARVKRLKESKAKEATDKANRVEQATNREKTKNDKKAWVPAEEFVREDKKRDRKRKKSESAKFQEEWDDLADEEMLFRKFKKGKISKKDYESNLFSDKGIERSLLEEKKQVKGDISGDDDSVSGMSDDGSDSD